MVCIDNGKLMLYTYIRVKPVISWGFLTVLCYKIQKNMTLQSTGGIAINLWEYAPKGGWLWPEIQTAYIPKNLTRCLLYAGTMLHKAVA